MTDKPGRLSQLAERPKIEKIAKAKNYSPEQIKQIRQEKSVPLLAQFKACL